MTGPQVSLMRRCLVAFYEHQEDSSLSPLVEVGWINGVDPRTAKSLIDVGLLVTDFPHWATETTNTHVRLPTFQELKE